jgi:hypothetical protein
MRMKSHTFENKIKDIKSLSRNFTYDSFTFFPLVSKEVKDGI